MSSEIFPQVKALHEEKVKGKSRDWDRYFILNSSCHRQLSASFQVHPLLSFTQHPNFRPSVDLSQIRELFGACARTVPYRRMDELQLWLPAAALLLALPGRRVNSVPTHQQLHSQDCEQNVYGMSVCHVSQSPSCTSVDAEVCRVVFFPHTVKLEIGIRGDSLAGGGHKN